jgi:hypothetical protein
VKTGLDDHYTLEGDSTGKIVVKVPNRPSDSSVRELLHLLRPFVLQSEATFFPKVTGRLWGYLAHPHLRALLAEHRDGFNHGYGRAYFQLAVSATLDGAMGQNNEDWFVINHRDDTKRARLREKLGTDPDELSLAIFRSMIADKARAVLHITSFLDELVASPSARRAREQPLG